MVAAMESSPDFTHGVQGYNYRKCRCPVCQAANTARNKQGRKHRQSLVAAGDPRVPHGRGGYTNWGCRCEVCTTANTEACSRYRQARRDRKASVT